MKCFACHFKFNLKNFFFKEFTFSSLKYQKLLGNYFMMSFIFPKYVLKRKNKRFIIIKKTNVHVRESSHITYQLSRESF